MDNIYEKPYAKFLEEAIQGMVQLPVTGICIIARLSDGAVFTQYHNSTPMDKMIYAGVIQQDVTMDILKANNSIGNDQDKEKE